jgi:hypothetical protein
MRTRRLRLALPALVAALAGGMLTLGGCGAGSSSSPLSIDQLPLVGGATVVTQARQCDRGANAYCAIEAVIAGHDYSSSGALVAAERRRLRTMGWSNVAGDNGKERAAESPGHRVRVTYATGSGDLLGVDLGWIKRPRGIALTLSRLMFSGTPAMSVMLEAGAG